MLERAEGDGGGVLVVVDGVFSMEGDLAPLPEITALCRKHGARLMVDEAHGVGVLGARGAGACELFGVEDEVDLRMGTFSKSLASCGGFIAGPAEVIDFLRVQSRAFMFTAAAVPAAIGAALGALAVIRSDEGPELMARVLDNARYLHAGLAELGYEVNEPTPMPDGTSMITPIVPVLVKDDWRAVMLWRALYDAGVFVNVAIYPAVPRGGALLRTSVMATHERSHLDRALEVFERVQHNLPEPPDTGAPRDGARGRGRRGALKGDGRSRRRCRLLPPGGRMDRAARGGLRYGRRRCSARGARTSATRALPEAKARAALAGGPLERADLLRPARRHLPVERRGHARTSRRAAGARRASQPCTAAAARALAGHVGLHELHQVAREVEGIRHHTPVHPAHGHPELAVHEGEQHVALRLHAAVELRQLVDGRQVAEVRVPDRDRVALHLVPPGRRFS